MRYALAFVLCACGASEPQTVTVAALPAPSSSVAPSTSATMTAPVATNGPHCPATFQLEKSGTCISGEAECAYPEGRCFCTDFPHCGGARPRPWTPGSRGRLVCTPSDPRTLRSDGCTFDAPTAGAACDKPGQSCVYGDCGWSAATYTCKSGRWDLHQYRGPPPP